MDLYIHVSEAFDCDLKVQAVHHTLQAFQK